MSKINYESDSPDKATGSTSALQKVSNLVNFQLSIEARIEQLEAELKEAKSNLLVCCTKTLPDALAEALSKGFITQDGMEVKLKPFYKASIPADEKGALKALAWLRKNGHEDLIKRTITVDFKKGEDDMAKAFAKHIKDEKLLGQCAQKVGVNSQTLGAWLKEQTIAGNAVPLELFQGFIGQRAVIKRTES